MATRKLYSSTSGQKKTIVDYSVLTKVKPQKSLLISKKSKAGRNSHGHITVRHRGGGAKRKIRIVDFKRYDKLDIPAKVVSIEYDPGRGAFISLLNYFDGEKRYIISPDKCKVGSVIICQERTPVEAGNCMQIGNIPTGYLIHCLEITSGKGAQLIKGAGTSGKVVSQDGQMTQVELPSKEVRYVKKNCFATIGSVSNSSHYNVRIGKAGRKRWMGIRPTVLGKSMNAADHPHGGGEGHTSTGRKSPMTPWGACALGKKTRSKSRNSFFVAKSR